MPPANAEHATIDPHKAQRVACIEQRDLGPYLPPPKREQASPPIQPTDTSGPSHSQPHSHSHLPVHPPSPAYREDHSQRVGAMDVDGPRAGPSATALGKRPRSVYEEVEEPGRKIRRLESELEAAETRERALRERLEQLEYPQFVSDLEGKLAATRDRTFRIQEQEREVFLRIKVLVGDDSLRDLPGALSRDGFGERKRVLMSDAAAIDALEREISSVSQRAKVAEKARRVAEAERERYTRGIGEIVNARQGPFMDPNILTAMMQVGDMAEDAMR
jgi:hypothetical protein